MSPRRRPWAVAALLAAVLGLVAWACGSEGRSSLARDSRRLEKVESTLTDVSGTTARLSEQIVTIQQSLQGTDQGMANDLAGIKASVDEIKASIGTVQKDIGAAKGADATLERKIDEVSAKLTSVDQRLWVLEARYNDHLRKLHGQ